MPGGDGTGPSGAGPATGRGAGLCAGNPVAGWANRGPWAGARGGRGGGRGGRGARLGGGGRGWRHRCWQAGRPGWLDRGPWLDEIDPEEASQVSAAAQRRALRRQARALERQLSTLRQRLDELETEQAVEEPEVG